MFIRKLEDMGISIESDGWFVFKPIERFDMQELRRELDQYHRVLIAA
jgi:hypothetical protein